MLPARAACANDCGAAVDCAWEEELPEAAPAPEAPPWESEDPSGAFPMRGRLVKLARVWRAAAKDIAAVAQQGQWKTDEKARKKSRKQSRKQRDT